MPDMPPIPLILPLGDRGLLVRFGEVLWDVANRAAIALAARIEMATIPGVVEVVPNLTLSTSAELRLRLRWVAILHGHLHADLAVTGGVHTAEDVIKAMMAGASVAMTTSALLLHGVEHLARLRHDLLAWMEQREYASIRQMQGSMSQRAVAEPAAFERANYLKVLRSWRRVATPPAWGPPPARAASDPSAGR